MPAWINPPARATTEPVMPAWALGIIVAAVMVAVCVAESFSERRAPDVGQGVPADAASRARQ